MDRCPVQQSCRSSKSWRQKKSGCSGTGYGGGSLWMASNESPRGIFQMDAVSGKLIRERQIPLALKKRPDGKRAS